MEKDPRDLLILALAEEVWKMSTHLSNLAERKGTPMKTDDTTNLKSLGTSGTEYATDGPSASVLETFPNPHPGADYQVSLDFGEFTSLCPKTGQPDFACLRIVYTPDERCVETKSLKLYLFRFRNQGAFMENITGQIKKDLVEVMNPKRLLVSMDFAPRGGIALKVDAVHDPVNQSIRQIMDESHRINQEIGEMLRKNRETAKDKSFGE